MKDILELRNISLFGKANYRLKKINLTIREGEKVALLGASGAGKSSLISVANGSKKADIGYVIWKEKLLRTRSNNCKGEIATIWQDLRLIEELNVSQNINCGALSRKSLLWSLINLMDLLNNEMSIRYMKHVQLPIEYSTKPVAKLSGGEKQRVAIARMFYQKAELLLGDEPVSNLDPNLGMRMIEILTKNTKEYPFIPNTSLISLHKIEYIKYFTRVIALKNGEIILDESAEKISQNELEGIYF
tara:strand:- start:420 stop:1154 length:735 start_codon:yes stop_codon:yes gene_type:complete